MQEGSDAHCGCLSAREQCGGADLDAASEWGHLKSLSLAGCNDIKSGILTNLCALNGPDNEAPLKQSLQDLDVSGLFITFPRAFEKTVQPFTGLTRLIMRDNRYKPCSSASPSPATKLDVLHA